MPGWLVTFAIHVALKFGVPFLLSKLPWLPEQVKEIIDELVGKLEDHKADIADSVEEAKDKIRSHYAGAK